MMKSSGKENINILCFLFYVIFVAFSVCRATWYSKLSIISFVCSLMLTEVSFRLVIVMHIVHVVPFEEVSMCLIEGEYIIAF